VRYVLSDPALMIATLLFGSLVVLALLGGVVWRQDPLAINVASALQPPSWAHPMGTDGSGRDVFARFIAGARISLLVAGVAVIVGTLIGGVAGLLAGVSRGVVDSVLMRVVDALLAFPPLILPMAVTVGLGVGLTSATLGIVLTTLPFYARLVRIDVLRIHSLTFVEAAVASGASQPRVVLRHIVPHTVSTLLIQSAAVYGYAILTLAALGFVGVGAQIPTPEWGAMITDGLPYALTGRWWITVFPGLGVLVAVVAVNMVADRARDIFDPRARIAVL
jgi:peptide/nickel transport system permease protein